MKFCNQDISKTIIARSFKLGQLIEDCSRLPGDFFKKKVLSDLLPFANLAIENL